jgi:hypothetical protein
MRSIRRLLTAAGLAIVATVAASTIGVGQAHALTGWTPYTVIAQASNTVGSVTATAEIRRGTELNRYYTRLTCHNTNTAETTVRVHSASSYSSNAGFIGSVQSGPWGNPTVVGYSYQFGAFNDYLQVRGVCEYAYDGHVGQVWTSWSAWVWVGLWTG